MPPTRTSRRRPIFGRVYPLMARAMDKGGMAERRRDLPAGLSGQVVEVGAGDGATFAHYPASVERVLAVEPEAHLRALATAAATAAPVSVEVHAGMAERLPVAGASVDAVVFALVLCSVPDQAVALAEAVRVLKPGGQVRFLEHVRADTPRLARVQDVLDATIWPHLLGGCHTGRDTLAAIERAGLRVEHLERFHFPPARTPLSFYVLGTAVAGGAG
ncbi:class I SAM-dependent methyltransferase [Nonomuraea sp. K274]|uniref:Class I SAM-dependent methyltransferase n=1 Tax=Nonomuraea cypriaca TaxID=1187855 RepID=A0A931A7P0_9ACTN|nr:class I SAM-dependent methyltransferase [Nonomuraea cypriaca]MBF8186189.1 class I SAM-dependent methyltransferase [Nonomuraea cypriaca]